MMFSSSYLRKRMVVRNDQVVRKNTLTTIGQCLGWRSCCFEFVTERRSSYCALFQDIIAISEQKFICLNACVAVHDMFVLYVISSIVIIKRS